MSEGTGKWAPRPGFIPGAVVNLGGHDLVLAPLNLDAIRHFDQRMRDAQARLAASPDTMTDVEQQQLFAEMIHASLVRNYADLDLDHVKALLDTENIKLAMRAIADPSGIKIAKPVDLGESQPAPR